MEDRVALNNTQVNAILDAAYSLVNKIAEWTSLPDSDDDKPALDAMALIQHELKALIDSCIDLNDRPHTPEEINLIVAASLGFMSKCAATFPNIDRLPEFLRSDVKALYWSLNDAGLIEAAE
jgi:hypothetical protein